MMSEHQQIVKTWVDLGAVGSPQRDAGNPQFVSDVRAWVVKIQPQVDGNPRADAFLLRSLQRFIDDQRLLAADLANGPYQPYDDDMWADGLGAYNGPLNICYHLGVKW
jgi:hypothetical protein